MKGFVRILEAIVASIILLSSLSYFFTISAQTNWNTALLQTNVEDTLATMDKTVLQDYIIENNKIAIENKLRSLLPDTVGFSTKLVGIPNPEIFIGCDCSDQEINDLKRILRLDPNDTIRFKERTITIKVKNESISSIDPRTNILFLFGYEDLTASRPFIDRFLERGGSTFMFAKIDNLDANLKEIFGLEEVTLGIENAADFYDTLLPANISSKIFDYFIGVGGNVSLDFGFFEEDIIGVDDRSIVVDSRKTNSYAKINYNINGKGRAIWLGNYDYMNAAEPELNTNKLLTALVLWGSGEEYSLDPIPKNVAKNFHEFGYIGVLNGFEPFEIRLKVWRIFY